MATPSTVTPEQFVGFLREASEILAKNNDPKSPEFVALLAKVAAEAGPEVLQLVKAKQGRVKPGLFSRLGSTIQAWTRKLPWIRSALAAVGGIPDQRVVRSVLGEGSSQIWRLIVAALALFVGQDQWRKEPTKPSIVNEQPPIAEESATNSLVPAYRPGQFAQSYFRPHWKTIPLTSCVGNLPKIDGDLMSDWNPKQFITSAFDEPWANAYFFRGAMMVDEEALYIAAEVGDPDPMQNHIAPIDGSDPSEQGAINVHLAIPLIPSGKTRYVRMMLWHHNAEPPEESGPCLWLAHLDNENNERLDGSPLPTGPLEKIPSSGHLSGASAVIKLLKDGRTGYVLEYKIPWKLILANSTTNPFFNANPDDWSADEVYKNESFGTRCAWEILWKRKDDPKSPIKISEVVKFDASTDHKTDPYENAGLWGTAVFTGSVQHSR